MTIVSFQQPRELFGRGPESRIESDAMDTAIIPTKKQGKIAEKIRARTATH
jgi:hypothetical protein